jgi:hypothetical protein
MAKDDIIKTFPNGKRLTKTKLLLKTYTGEDLKPIGVANVNVQYRENSYDNLESVSEFSPVQCNDLVFFLKCGLLLALYALTI